jgi:predicted porin
MNHTTTRLCAAIALLGATSAWAQGSSVTIYGIADVAAEYDSGVNAGAGKSGNQMRMGLGTWPSRLGFRGTEDLGGGQKALFNLEAGLNLDTGGLGQGRMFGRQASVGLSGGFGTVLLGRLYSMRYYGMMDTDFFGPGSHGLGTVDSGIPNTRIDNAVSWRGSAGPFSGGLSYSLGRDTVAGNNPAATGCAGESATDTSQCREWSAMAKYDGGRWGVVTAYERQNGGTAATYGGLTSSNLTDSRFSLGGYLHAAGGKLGVGWLARNNEGSTTTPRSNLFWLVGEKRISAPVTLTGMVAHISFKDSANKATLLTLRASYALSKRTTVYVSDAYIRNSGTLALAASANSPGTGPLPGRAQNSLQVGITHRF